MTERTDEKTAAYVRRVADYIADQIERGLADPDQWVAPWQRVAARDLMPYNPATEQPYTGGNRWALFVEALITGCPGHWATFKQWQQIGAQVRKGEHAAARALRPLSRSWEDDEGTKHVTTFGFTSYPIFHAGQVDGYDMPATDTDDDAPTHDDDTRADIDAAYTWAATIGARVEASDTAGASYSPQLDRVMVPSRDRWMSADGAWSTIAHECTHWTGHESRLHRTFGKRFGDDAYAVEELVAELGAATVLAMRGRSTEPRPDHAQYLAHWLRVLREKPSALFTAAAAAEKAASYLAARAVEIGAAA